MAAAHARRGRTRRKRYEPPWLTDPPARRKPKPLINPLADPCAPRRRPRAIGWDAVPDPAVVLGHDVAGAGESARERRYPLEFGPVDVIEIRARFHASQRQFARMIGINVRTLRNWEQGRRRPQGPARAILRVAAANPNLVAAVLLKFRRVWWMDW